MKTVLVTGANGQLGSSIHARISQYPCNGLPDEGVSFCTW